MVRRILPLFYVLVGLVVASNRGYLAGLDSLANILNALLAIALWPLLLLGLRISITG